MSTLELRAVSKVYGDGPTEVRALHDISLAVDQGELVAVMGPSGSGKSTLLTIAGSLEEPTSGEVVVGGAVVARMSRADRARLRRRFVGFVFQDFNLLNGLTAVENVSLPLELDGMAAKAARAAGMAILDDLGLSARADRMPDELSGGERQRVAIGRAIVNQPDVLLADEPVGNLDPLNSHQVVEILKRINELGTTVILTSHNKGIVDGLGKRVVTMDNGHVVRDDKEGRYVI